MEESAEDQLLRTYDTLVDYEFHAKTMNDIKAYAAAYSRFVLEIIADELVRVRLGEAAAIVLQTAERKTL